MIISLESHAKNIHAHSTMYPSPSPTSFSVNKRRPLLSSSSSSTSFCSGRFGEVAGETTAECAAICCCCPCGLANFLFLTIYKVPAGLCRRALRRKRRQNLVNKGLLPQRTRKCQCGCDDTEIQIHPTKGVVENSLAMVKFDEEEEIEAMVRLEKEMWETFYGTGFWRSPSQKESSTHPSINDKS